MLPIKNLTFGLAFVLVSSATSGIATAQSLSYTVKSGDTVGAIATRHGLKIAELAQANNLSNSHKLKLGQKLTIPIHLASTTSTPVVKQAGGYAVRNGDNDWSIARRNGIKPHDLRVANPSVNWRNLKIGTLLSIPGQDPVRVVTAVKAEPVQVAGKYTVKPGDNDWTIASRLGTTPKKIRLANPGIKWTRIKPGDTLLIPTASGQVVAAGKVTGSTSIRSRYAVVTGNSVIVRRVASTSGGRITNVSAGTKAKVISRKNEWYKLRFPMGTEGWVRGDLLAATNPPRVSEVVRRQKAASAVVSKVSQAPTRRIANRGGRKPSVMTSPTFVSGAATSVVSRAQGFRGVRYSYGSASRSATDCSGLTSQVYRSVGIKLPRTSRDQARVGQSVSKGSLKAGDLVFFKTSRGNRISHVGIYQGDGKFIHASTGVGRVTVNSLSDGYYAKRYVTARRVAKGSSKSVAVAKKVVKSGSTKVVAKAEPFPESVPPLEPATKSAGRR